MTLADLQQILQLISSITSIIGIPIGIYLFYDAKRKEQRDREYGTYNALDEKYIEYLKLCLQNPDLDVFDIPLRPARKATPEQMRKEEVMFAILLSILERAYLMYKDQSNAARKAQFSGWEDHMRTWSRRPNFRRVWRKAGFDPHTYDKGFYQHMSSLVEAHPESGDEKS